jgi:hypothetical protein
MLDNDIAILIAVCTGSSFLLLMIGMLAGCWLSYRLTKQTETETFLGSESKGEMFRIPSSDLVDAPEEDQGEHSAEIKARMMNFLKRSQLDDSK